MIAIARGWNPSETGYQEITAAVERAKKEGVFVISSSVGQTHGLLFHGLGRDPMANPDEFTSYDDSSWDKYYLDDHSGVPAPILVPMDSRTVASFSGTEDYAFFRQGGWSWAIPYVAGLYALACQVNQDVTPELFWAKAVETGDTVEIPAKAAPVMSAEELDRRVAAGLEEIMKHMKSAAKGADLEQVLGAAYTRQTGVRRDTMTEADFRVWAAQMLRTREGPDTRPHTLGLIVNPARLIASLQSPS